MVLISKFTHCLLLNEHNSQLCFSRASVANKADHPTIHDIRESPLTGHDACHWIDERGSP